MNSKSSKRLFSTCADAASIPSAIGRSKRLPSLGRSAGASEIVMRPSGNLKPALMRAALTRSFAFQFGPTPQIIFHLPLRMAKPLPMPMSGPAIPE